MEVAGTTKLRTPGRELTGERAQKIIAAMRESVASRGVAGSTFDRVARQAGVSRGLLHYYFGTKERLLVEVVRHDAEVRVARLEEPLARARTADDVLQVLVANLQDLMENEPGFFVLLYELFSAGRRNPKLRAEVAEMFNRTRERVAEILARKQEEGVVELRSDPVSVVSVLYSLADGFAIQFLSDPERDHSAALEAATAAARHLLTSG